MEKIVLNGPGLYIAHKNGNSTNRFLITVIGKMPMLRVVNALDINRFANGRAFSELDQVSEAVVEDIIDNPDSYAYSRFDSMPKLLRDKHPYTPEEYQKWIKMKRDNILESSILTDICKTKGVEFPQAKEIWNQICAQG